MYSTGRLRLGRALNGGWGGDALLFNLPSLASIPPCAFDVCLMGRGLYSINIYIYIYI